MRLFKKMSPVSPVDEETRQFIDCAFDWMVTVYGKGMLLKGKVFTPTPEDFPIKALDDERSFNKLKSLMCKRMGLDPKKVLIGLYDSGTPDGRKLPEGRWESHSAAGVYLGTHIDGRSAIAIDERYLRDPIGLVATIAHELAHIRLIGEKHLKRKDPDHELYTDLLCIFFGFGLFSAIAAFRTDGWTEGLMVGWSQHSSGYLSLRQIGYALGRYSYLRGDLNPKWLFFIPDSVSPYLKKTLRLFKYEAEQIAE